MTVWIEDASEHDIAKGGTAVEIIEPVERDGAEGKEDAAFAIKETIEVQIQTNEASARARAPSQSGGIKTARAMHPSPTQHRTALIRFAT